MLGYKFTLHSQSIIFLFVWWQLLSLFKGKLVAFPGRSTCRMFSEPQLVAESSLTAGKLREFEEQWRKP